MTQIECLPVARRCDPLVTFVAMLELARETLVQITQAEPFAPIYVRLAYQTS